MKNLKLNNRGEVISIIDNLFKDVRNFRNSEEFYGLINFCSNPLIKHMSCYNLFLVRQQMPGATLVYSASKWRSLYGRELKPNARPLVILVPFGPVGFVFDISDTIDTGRKKKMNNELVKLIENPFETHGAEVPGYVLNNLIDNLALYGICFDDEFEAARNYGGRIESLVIKQLVKVKLFHRKSIMFEYYANHLLSVNHLQTKTEKFATICHELGHFFCHHVPTPFKEWVVREHLSKEIVEFEAETVSWIVCKKLGIEKSSEKYIASYLSKPEIPAGASVEMIFEAVNCVMDMLLPMDATEGMLYKFDSTFREFVDYKIESILQFANKPF